MDYIRSQKGANGNVQLVVQTPIDIVAGDNVYIKSMSGAYDGIRRVESIETFLEKPIVALQIANTPFLNADVGLVAKNSSSSIPTVAISNPNPAVSVISNGNPGTTNTTAPVQAAKTAAQLKTLVSDRITKIKTDPAKVKDIVNNYYNRAKSENAVGRLGATQWFACKAILELKAEGILLPTELGATKLQVDNTWIKANFVFDEYVDPALTAAENEAKADVTYKNMVATRILKIKANDYGHYLVLEAIKANKPSGMGYTQMLAYTAISELKAEKAIPIDRWGAGQYGHTAWVKANYPADIYIAPVTQTIKPAAVQPVDPNPGTVTTPVIQTVTPTPVKVQEVVKPSVAESEKNDLMSNPLVKLGLIFLAIIVFLKIIK